MNPPTRKKSSPPLFFFCKDNLFMNQGYYQSSHCCREREQTSTSTLLTLGYGYCFPLGYNAPVNRGITMLGTNESFIIRKASLSPSGDHQWAMWECRSSSRINERYLKPTVEMWAQWPTNICPWNLHCTYTLFFLYNVLDFINMIENSVFLSYPFSPRTSRCNGRK